MKHYSPLRYPGGKGKISAFIGSICANNNLSGHYVEPYAGGSSVALFLLLEGYMKKITINDFDRSIYAFWHSVLNNTQKFCKLIENTEFTIENWRRQKLIQKNKIDVELLELGYSTFFLNRTNRSGIITGGVIGGVDQTGNYKMNCRFNIEELTSRIRFIAAHKRDINLFNLDALELIDQIEFNSDKSDTMYYFDPPYFLKGPSLYMNFYEYEDHVAISKKIKKIKNAQWIVSYDRVPEIIDLYSIKSIQTRKYSLTHTAYEPRNGDEVFFFSKSLKIPLNINK